MLRSLRILQITARTTLSARRRRMAMSVRPGGVIRPGEADADLASRAARRIRDYLAAHPGTDPVTIRGELAGDDALVVPRAATVMFAQILALLASGQGAQIIPDAAELTTQQAADFLNVSRPFLIGLLEGKYSEFV